MVAIEADARRITIGKKGPLPGPIQSNNRAEMYVVLDAVANARGDVEFWNDSDILCEDWQSNGFQITAFHWRQ